MFLGDVQVEVGKPLVRITGEEISVLLYHRIIGMQVHMCVYEAAQSIKRYKD